MADIDTMTEDTENTENMDTAAEAAKEAAAEAEKQAQKARNLERGKLQSTVILAVANALKNIPELKGAQLIALDAGSEGSYVHLGRIRFILPDGDGLEVTVNKDAPKNMYWGW